MTITMYAVHIYDHGRYRRTVEDLLSRKAAHRYAKTFNALHGESDERAFVEAVPVEVSPPESMPTGLVMKEVVA